MATTAVSPTQNQNADYNKVAWLTIDHGDRVEEFCLEIGLRDGAWSLVSHEVDHAMLNEDGPTVGPLVAEGGGQVNGPDPLTALLALVRGHEA